MRILVGLISFALALPLAGCGTSAVTCQQLTMSIMPASVTLSHTATLPANQQQFAEGYTAAANPGCAIPNVIELGPLTSSDPIDVPVTANGLVTCVNATSGPVTLSSKLTTKTATITCQ